CAQKRNEPGELVIAEYAEILRQLAGVIPLQPLTCFELAVQEGQLMEYAAATLHLEQCAIGFGANGKAPASSSSVTRPYGGAAFGLEKQGLLNCCFAAQSIHHLSVQRLAE